MRRECFHIAAYLVCHLSTHVLPIIGLAEDKTTTFQDKNAWESAAGGVLRLGQAHRGRDVTVAEPRRRNLDDLVKGLAVARKGGYEPAQRPGRRCQVGSIEIGMCCGWIDYHRLGICLRHGDGADLFGEIEGGEHCTG